MNAVAKQRNILDRKRFIQRGPEPLNLLIQAECRNLFKQTGPDVSYAVFWITDANDIDILFV